MLDPYKMVVVNLIFPTLLLLGILVYKYVYPKRNINLLFLLILISLLPLISILRKGTYESGDLSLHAGFAMSFFESLSEMNIVPVWNNEIMNGYGYPLFLFIYPLPYYVASLFHAIGFSFISSIKIILGTSFIISGIGMYVLMKEELKNKYFAFVSALFYLFAPYHLVDTHFRVAIGEVMSFAILPLCFFSIKKINNKSSTWIILTAVFFSLLILSHQVISIVSLPFLMGYSLLIWLKNKKMTLLFLRILSLITGILLATFYWLPNILESRFTHIFTQGTIFFPSFSQFLYSPWRFGFLFQGHKGELSFIVGYAHWVILIVSVFIFIKSLLKNNAFKEQKLYIFSLLSFFMIFITMQSFTAPLWKTVPFLSGFQFSYRLLVFTSFFIAIIAGITIKKINNRWITIGICTIVVISTILNWGNRRTIPEINDDVINLSRKQNISKVGPGTFTWANTDTVQLDYRDPDIATLHGSASVTKIMRNSTRREYLINVISDIARFKEKTLFFPNWSMKVDNISYPFDINDPEFPGVITFDLPKGEYNVQLIFQDTLIRSFSKWISAISLITIIMFAFTSKKLLNFPKF